MRRSKNKILVGQRGSTRRGGLSILEVMISVGIASLGLFGALALIPLASQLTTKGLREDNKTSVGKSAIQIFEVRGMRRPENWFRAGTVPPTAASAAFTGTPTPFVIDPRVVNSAGNNNGPQWFPINRSNVNARAANANFQIQRITLLSGPRPATTAAFPPLMTRQMADEIFQTTDDLVFRQQEDATLPPLQEFAGQTSAATPVKRQSEGRTSWMAMVMPSDPTIPSNSYILSIVVFSQRNTTWNALPEIERVTNVTFPSTPGVAFSGGDVILTTTSPSRASVLTDQGRIADLDINEDDWIMLAADADGTVGAPFTTVFRWYRVLAVGDIQLAGGNRTRRVTLLGPDWNANAAPNGFQTTTQAVYAPGVVAVYERTISLESTSLWRD